MHAAWTDLRAVEPDTNIFYARSDDLGASFSSARQLDDSRVGFDPNRDTPTNQWHPSLAAAGSDLFVAWQDNRLGNNDVFFTHSPDGGASFDPSERVDDTGGGQSEQTRPRLAVVSGPVLCGLGGQPQRQERHLRGPADLPGFLRAAIGRWSGPRNAALDRR